MALFGAFAVLVLGLQSLASHQLKLNPEFVHWLPFGYFPMFYLGTLAFVVRRHLKAGQTDDLTGHKRYRWSMLLLASIFVAMMVASSFRPLNGRIAEAFFVVATFITIVTYREGPSAGLLRSRPLLFMGSISFSFYLLHYLVILFVPNPVEGLPGRFAVQLAMSIAVSVVWSEIFEKRLYHRAKAAIKRLV
jgi:peptidoglycan/LPS O-acetylase OafA/YrhL